MAENSSEANVVVFGEVLPAGIGKGGLLSVNYIALGTSAQERHIWTGTGTESPEAERGQHFGSFSLEET